MMLMKEYLEFLGVNAWYLLFDKLGLLEDPRIKQHFKKNGSRIAECLQCVAEKYFYLFHLFKDLNETDKIEIIHLFENCFDIFSNFGRFFETEQQRMLAVQETEEKYMNFELQCLLLSRKGMLALI